MSNPSIADDVLSLLFITATAAPPLRCSPSGTPARAAIAALRRVLPHDDETLALLIFAAHSAELIVAAAGRFTLSPTTADWTDAPSTTRLAALRAAVLAHPLSTRRWRAARLPGWRLLSNLPSIDALVPAGSPNSPRNVARRIGRLSSDLVLSDSPASSALALAAALSRADALFSPQRSSRQRPLSVQFSFEDARHRASSFSISCPSPPARSFLELAACADLVAPDTLLFHADSFARALTLGASAAHLLQMLDRLLPTLTRPPAFDAAVRRWSRTHGRLRLHEVLLLEARSAADLDDALHARRARAAVARTLSPRAVVVDRRFAPALRRRLRRLPGFVDASLPADETAFTPGVHLYLAARIAHALPDLVPLPWRTPHALVDQLLRALSPSERNLAEQAFISWQSSLGQRALPASWSELDAPSPDSLEPRTRAMLDRCTSAVAAAHALHFEYHGRDDASPTRRSVDPLRIEWRRSLPYLVAFDLIAEEERTFRVDRIVRFLDSSSAARESSSSEGAEQP